jgi:phosphoribosyl 1,2-cyclic phosphodiesterase
MFYIYIALLKYSRNLKNDSRKQVDEMKITFLGTAGGRMVIMTQLRASGGWILEMDGERIHVDPGPGALVRANQFGINLKKLSGMVISHAHTDHYTDAEMIVESMTNGTRVKRGVVLGNEHSIYGGDDYRPSLSPFHVRLLDKLVVMKPGDKAKIGKVEVTATPTKHSEGKALGFVFRGSQSLGYTGDSEYFEGQEKHFEGCEYLVLNVLRPRETNWPKHMNTNQAAKLISKVRPKVAVLQHFGMLMIRAGEANEAKWIEETTGVKTIAAKDGMTIDFESGKSGVAARGLEKWTVKKK